jgi:hypothetical protein
MRVPSSGPRAPGLGLGGPAGALLLLSDSPESRTSHAGLARVRYPTCRRRVVTGRLGDFAPGPRFARLVQARVSPSGVSMPSSPESDGEADSRRDGVRLLSDLRSRRCRLRHQRIHELTPWSMGGLTQHTQDTLAQKCTSGSAGIMVSCSVALGRSKPWPGEEPAPWSGPWTRRSRTVWSDSSWRSLRWSASLPKR